MNLEKWVGIWAIPSWETGIREKGRSCAKGAKMVQNCCREVQNWPGGPLCSPDWLCEGDDTAVWTVYIK